MSSMRSMSSSSRSMEKFLKRIKQATRTSIAGMEWLLRDTGWQTQMIPLYTDRDGNRKLYRIGNYLIFPDAAHGKASPRNMADIALICADTGGFPVYGDPLRQEFWLQLTVQQLDALLNGQLPEPTKPWAGRTKTWLGHSSGGLTVTGGAMDFLEDL